MVLQRFSDPRFGETTYRLVNVVRGEPSPDLFQVPQGYELSRRTTGRGRCQGRPGCRRCSSSYDANPGAGAAIRNALRASSPARA